jgi:hypothetical protein
MSTKQIYLVWLRCLISCERYHCYLHVKAVKYAQLENAFLFQNFVKHFSTCCVERFACYYLCNMVMNSNGLFLDFCSFPRFTICGVSAVILLGSLITLGYIDEDEERHNFGHKGGKA